MSEIEINPITRLEGHGNIKIFTEDDGTLKQAYLQIPELRAFEKFCVGRQAEYMPQLTSRICGVCPVPHHLASIKTLDMAYNAPPTERATALRRIMHYGYMIEDHLLHFYYLGGPDLLLGPDTPVGKRNIIGIIETYGKEIASTIMEHRKYGQEMVRMLGGKAIHPAFGIPGGVSKGLTEEEREEVRSMAESCIEFAQTTLSIFHDKVMESDFFADALKSSEYELETYNLGTVNKDNQPEYYDGDLRLTDTTGTQLANFVPFDYLDYIGEAVEEYSYMKFPFYRKLGWKGLVESPENGVYRVGPLGRYNASTSYSTPLANEEGKLLEKTLGRPCNMTLAYHWTRLTEVLNVSEMLRDLADSDILVEGELRNPVGEIQGRGVGSVEAARGTLIHDYVVDDDGLIKDVNLIVPTTHNAAAISLSIAKAARAELASGNTNVDQMNRVEVALRAYDPCFGCATH